MKKKTEKKPVTDGLVGPVTPETYDRFDEYDCRPDTPHDKIDPALAKQIEEDRKFLADLGK